MKNDFLTKARIERAELTNKLRKIEIVITYLENSSNEISIQSPIILSTKFENMSAPKAAREALRMHGNAMHVNDIITKMYEHGFSGQLNRRKLYVNLYGSMLKRNKNIFSKIKGKKACFGLVEWNRP